MRESDIMYENGEYWVCRGRGGYTVYETGLTHSTADSSYPRDADGLSIAIARCDYLEARRVRASLRGRKAGGVEIPA